jgi:hypothetical protein
MPLIVGRDQLGILQPRRTGGGRQLRSLSIDTLTASRAIEGSSDHSGSVLESYRAVIMRYVRRLLCSGIIMYRRATSK